MRYITVNRTILFFQNYNNLKKNTHFSDIDLFSAYSVLCFRGESLDNLDSPRSHSWRQTPWLHHSTGVYASSSVQDFSRPPPQMVSTSNRAYMRTPSSSIPPPSTGSVRTPSAPSPTPRSQSPSATQSGSQLRNK